MTSKEKIYLTAFHAAMKNGDNEKIEQLILERSQLYTAYSVKNKDGKFTDVIDVKSVAELIRELIPQNI